MSSEVTIRDSVKQWRWWATLLYIAPAFLLVSIPRYIVLSVSIVFDVVAKGCYIIENYMYMLDCWVANKLKIKAARKWWLEASKRQKGLS